MLQFFLKFGALNAHEESLDGLPILRESPFGDETRRVYAFESAIVKTPDSEERGHVFGLSRDGERVYFSTDDVSDQVGGIYARNSGLEREIDRSALIKYVRLCNGEPCNLRS